jgi:hypothetical protein
MLMGSTTTLLFTGSSDVILPMTEQHAVLICILCIFALLQGFEYNCGGEGDKVTDIVISVPASTDHHLHSSDD